MFPSSQSQQHAFILKHKQETAVFSFFVLPLAQFRVSGCLAMTRDRATQKVKLSSADSGRVLVTTRRGSSFQPALCSRSVSPFSNRGSDSKRTASVSTGSLWVKDEQRLRQQQLMTLKVSQMISHSYYPSLMCVWVCVLHWPLLVCCQLRCGQQRQQRGHYVFRVQIIKQDLRRRQGQRTGFWETETEVLVIRTEWRPGPSLTSTTFRAADTTSGTSSFRQSITASLRKTWSRLCCSWNHTGDHGLEKRDKLVRRQRLDLSFTPVQTWPRPSDVPPPTLGLKTAGVWGWGKEMCPSPPGSAEEPTRTGERSGSRLVGTEKTKTLDSPGTFHCSQTRTGNGGRDVSAHWSCSGRSHDQRGRCPEPHSIWWRTPGGVISSQSRTTKSLPDPELWTDQLKTSDVKQTRLTWTQKAGPEAADAGPGLRPPH